MPWQQCPILLPGANVRSAPGSSPAFRVSASVPPGLVVG
ncbi:hypothetical protein D187_001376 [Cystobacter fuscus DSM 2262]|uniref:Uncharacterized protein n=1 Tax=Cystobacter fuscus (strain ATCC 25194 / DSM 2262 / NBRC 100088 / M29) TaxID=1242864 RepID=S9PEF5_CYSF2|nr:hypothetical protein D187_001376 [Cystobacter fuscus DSM 2262]